MWKRAKIPYFPPFLIHGTWWENGKGFHSGGGGGGFPHGFHVESTGKCGRGCFFFFSQTCREVSPAGDLLLPLAAKVGKNAIQTCGLKIRPRYTLLILIPCTTRSQNRFHAVPYDELTSLLRRCTPRVLVPLRFTAPLMRCNGRSVSVVRRWHQRQRRCC